MGDTAILYLLYNDIEDSFLEVNVQIRSCSFQVRSLTLDVKVWEPSVLNLFQSLGNTFANSVWEELLQSKGVVVDLLGTTG